MQQPKRKPQPRGLLSGLTDGLSSPLAQLGLNIFASSTDGDGIGHGIRNGMQGIQQAEQNQMQQQQGQLRNKLLLAQIANSRRGPAPTAEMREYYLSKTDPGFGKYQRSLRRSDVKPRFMNVGGKIVRVDPTGETKEIYSKPPSALDKVISGALGQTGQDVAGQAPTGGNPLLHQQSFEGGSDPNLILTAGADQPQGQPAQAAQDDTVNVPLFGSMPRENARNLAAALAAEGKGDLANIIMGELGDKGDSLAKPTINKIEGKLFDSSEAMTRLATIEQGFKEDYLRLDSRIGYEWSNIKDKFLHGTGLAEMSPDEKTSLEEFSAWRQSSLENLNLYIKEITGAQMSEAEATRLRKAMPDPGDSLFDGDGPTQFRSKMKNALKQTRMATIRYNYLRKQGFQGTAKQAAAKLGLQGMEQLLNKTAQRFSSEARRHNPKAKPDQINQMVGQRMKQEFGI